LEEVKPELQSERRRSRRLSVNFGLFNDATDCQFNTVWLDFGATRIRKCDMLNRLIHGLKFYSNLDIDTNEVDKDEFNNFFDDTYKNMLDDYLHCINVHSDDLEEIHDSLRSKYHFSDCNVRNCSFSKRHFDGKKHYNKNDDPWINFYIETYDSLHFWLFHLYSVGLRSKKKDKRDDEKQRIIIKLNDEKEDECYDGIFAKMIERINKKRDCNNSKVFIYGVDDEEEGGGG